jgi:hypothetical protein
VYKKQDTSYTSEKRWPLEVSHGLAPYAHDVAASLSLLFQERTWQRIVVLLVGTLLARGRRTVTAALRHTGHQDDPH